MISRSSLNKLLIYLAGLMATCFLHLSCQVLSSSTLGMDTPSPCSSVPSAHQNITNTNIVDIAMAGVCKRCYKLGYTKVQTVPLHSTVMQEFGQDVAYHAATKHGQLYIIADGVSGFQETSRFIENITEEIRMRIDLCNITNDLNLEEVLRQAHKTVAESQKFRDAATTISVIHIDPNRLLKYVTVGDSGFTVFDTKTNIVLKSETTEYGINDPHMLGLYSDANAPDCRITSNQYDAITGKVQLPEEYIIVMYTDGFSDNVFDSELRARLNKALDNNETSTELAKDYVNNLAHPNSLNTEKETPYRHKIKEAEAARKALQKAGTPYDDYEICYNPNGTGGKKDDIGVMVIRETKKSRN